MTTTQQPEALNLEEFRAKVTRAAREPLLARIAELEAVLSAMGEKGNPVEPADIPRATDQDTHFFLAGWNGRAAQVDPHEHFRNAAATAPAYPAEGVPVQVVELEVDDLIDRLLNAQQDLNLAANVHMDQSIASASTLLDEVEIALRALAATHPTQQGLDAQTEAARSVLAERARQVAAEGWTPERDDEYTRGILGEAGGIYALHAFDPRRAKEVPEGWPWNDVWWKPKDPRTNLVKAGALILAEIERMDRSFAARAKQGGAA